MTVRFFTFVSEFRGTTNVSQVSAANEEVAVKVWAALLRKERPFDRASNYIAKSVERDLSVQPVAICGAENVWCITGVCGGDLMLANIVETVSRKSIGHRDG